MKTRDPELPGAHRQSPIKPGTLCLTVDSRDVEWPAEYLGKTVTVRSCDGRCFCGNDLYVIAAVWLPLRHGLAHRCNLQPILPPGIDDQVERSVGNPQLEVV